MPLVSVIIPAFNAVATLPETYACLQKQTFNDFEILFVDDASTDNTVPLIEGLASRDARIKLIRMAMNGGVSKARNAAIHKAKGEFLLFLDADDLITPDHLAQLLQFSRKHADGDVLYCGYRRLFPDGRTSDVCFDPALQKNPLKTLYKYSALAVHCVLIKRQLVIENGGFDENLRTSEDWDLWLRLALKGAKFYGLNKCCAIYRTSQGSLSNRLSNMLPDAFKVLARAYAEYPQASERFPLAVHQTLYALWCITNDFIRGKHVDDILDPIYFPADLSLYTREFGLYVADGLRHGLAGTNTSLLDGFTRAQPFLHKIASILAARSTTQTLEKSFIINAEQEILKKHVSHQLAVLGTCAGFSTDVFSEITIPALPAHIDRLVINLIIFGKKFYSIIAPVYGAPTSDNTRRAIAPEAPAEQHNRFIFLPLRLLRFFMNECVTMLRPFAASLVKKRAGLVPMFRAIRLGVLKKRFLAAFLSFSGTRLAAPHAFNDAIMDKSKFLLAQIIGASHIQLPTEQSVDVAPSAPEYWEKIFAKPDPWNYSSPYEELKYQRTLALLKNSQPEKVLELACAEGHFTLKCAPHVKNILATDISPTALNRAKERCKAFNNISYQLLDFANENIPAGFDVIVASESLYYLKNKSALNRFARKLAQAAGARILTAHAYVLAENPDKAGFDWDVPYGAAAIEEAFLATGLLECEQSFKTEAYSINLFRKKSCAPAAPVPAEVLVVVDEPEPPASFLRPKDRTPMTVLLKQEATTSIPVLMYHRVSHAPLPALSRYNVTPQSFEEQMRFLQHHGYYPISTAHLSDCMKRGYAMLGRPVLITFDDGYADFYENAAPILEKIGFTAEVFLPVDKVGTLSDWDAHYGPAAPLLSWEQIAELSHKGNHFASHLASHTPAPVLETSALVDEALRSRLILETRLGKPVSSVATPYGASDERVHAILKACGYSLGFKADGGRASRYEPRYALPRIEITGDDTLVSFAAKLGHTVKTE